MYINAKFSMGATLNMPNWTELDKSIGSDTSENVNMDDYFKQTEKLLKEGVTEFMRDVKLYWETAKVDNNLG